MKYVLFVCNHNAGRSQMAQAFFERHAPEDIRAESAGSTPAKDLAGRDRGDERDRDRSLRAPAAAALPRGAAARRLGGDDGLRRRLPLRSDDGRGLGDPRPPRAGRSRRCGPIRDAIEARVRELVETELDVIRTDRTAHQMRLIQLLPGLAKEFEGQRSDGEIRACADAVLSRFEDVPIRSHVMTLAHRKTRECLAAEHCSELAPA
jgi:hypothetical protein